MQKCIVPSCLLLLLGLSSFQKPLQLQESIVEKNMPRVGRKQARQVWLETIESYALSGQWRQLGHIAKAAIDDQVSINQILELAERIQVEPFLRALVATQNIRALHDDSGITKSELLRIALFIETELDEARQELGSDYLSRRKTGLERTVEYNPESKLVFIHLKDRGVDEVGRGVKKIVTKSILYDVENPQYAACCSSTYSMQNEIAALKYMQGASGIVKLYATSERDTGDGVKIYTMFCKLYEGGALSRAFADGYKFTFRQKLDIIRDLLEGLSAIHSKGFVHRDLSARNILIDNNKKGTRKKRSVGAVIADFGRIKHIDTANGSKVQFNSRYLAPEGIIAERLSGEDYYATDLFALGCVLHKLHFEKSGPWIDKANLKNPTQPDAVKEAKFIHDLKNYREVRLSKIVLNRGYGVEFSTGDLVEHLILQMIHPDPAKRGTAYAHVKAINEIIERYEQRSESKFITSATQQEEVSEDGVSESVVRKIREGMEVSNEEVLTSDKESLILDTQNTNPSHLTLETHNSLRGETDKSSL